MKKNLYLLSILILFGYTFAQNGLYFHAFNKTGWTPVHHAAALGNTEALSFLCKHVPEALDKKSRKRDGTTPLFVALLYGQIETANYLITHGANTTNLWDSSTGGSPLHLLATKNRSTTIQDVINWNQQHNILDIDDQDRAERTPLMLAVQNNDIHTVRILLEADADLYAVDENGCNVLKYASFPYGRAIDIFEELAALWNPEKDPFNATPLHYAVLIGNRKAVRAELNRDQKQKNRRNASGATPLFLALMLGQTEIADLLIDDKTCQHEHLVNNAGNTPLHIAIEMRNVIIIDLMLNWIRSRRNQLAWMVNACNSQFKTPLDFVYECLDAHNRIHVARLLSQFGAPIEKCGHLFASAA